MDPARPVYLQLAFTSTPGSAGAAPFLSTGSLLGDIVFPSSTSGTLYVTDTDRNAIYAVRSTHWPVNASRHNSARSLYPAGYRRPGYRVAITDLAESVPRGSGPCRRRRTD